MSIEYEVYSRQVSTDLMKPPTFTSISDNLLLKDPEINEAEYIAQKETVRYVCSYYLINNASAN